MFKYNSILNKLSESPISSYHLSEKDFIGRQFRKDGIIRSLKQNERRLFKMSFWPYNLDDYLIPIDCYPTLDQELFLIPLKIHTRICMAHKRIRTTLDPLFDKERYYHHGIQI